MSDNMPEWAMEWARILEDMWLHPKARSVGLRKGIAAALVAVRHETLEEATRIIEGWRDDAHPGAINIDICALIAKEPQQ